MPEASDDQPGAEDSDGQKVSLETQRSYDRCMNRFEDLLLNRVRHHQGLRKSAEPADSDVEEAYRDLMHRPAASKIKRGFGDLLMISSGLFFPLAINSATHGIDYPMYFVAGAAMALAGVYIREFTK